MERPPLLTVDITDGRDRVGNAVAAGAAVVEHQHITRTGKFLRDDVGRMLAEDQAKGSLPSSNQWFDPKQVAEWMCSHSKLPRAALKPVAARIAGVTPGE